MSKVVTYFRKRPGLYMAVHPLYQRVTGLWREVTHRVRDEALWRRRLKEYQEKTRGAERFLYDARYRYKILSDWRQDAGSLSSYFWQDLWAARLIHENNPSVHYDIGSRVDGFIAHLASFRGNIVLIDIRPMKDKIPGVEFVQSDATSLKELADESVESISALCSLEHFGLGRYGDPVDPEACFSVMKSIVRVLARGGNAYISVPIGWEHLEFDAQRIFYASTIREEFEPLRLVEFSATMNAEIERNIEINRYDEDKIGRGLRFGLFHFVKD